jgi:hypothetical protein
MSKRFKKSMKAGGRRQVERRADLKSHQKFFPLKEEVCTVWGLVKILTNY